MEIVKVRVRPKNCDRRMRSLLFASAQPVDMKLVRQKLSELFPFGYWLDEDKIERYIVDFSYAFGEFCEMCCHEYLEKYKTEPIKYYTNEEVNNSDFVRSALDAT